VSSAVLAWRDYGSVDAADWLMYAIVTTLVLAVATIARAAVKPLPVAAAGAVCLLALGCWVAASVAWSPLPALGRDEALLTALYAVTLWTGLTTLHTPGERRAAMALVVAVLAVLALGTEFRLWRGNDLAALFISGRLDSPVTYPNADAAFFLVGFWPAIYFAARRATPILARAAASAAATALLAGALLAQSKGGFIALAVSGIVFFAVSPARMRALVPTLVACSLVAATSGPLTAPYRASGVRLPATIRHAGAVALALAVAAAVVGVVWALIDRRVSISPRTHRVLGTVTLVMLVAALAGSTAAFAARVDHPTHWAAEKWRSFKTLPRRQEGATHLFSLGSNRYDFWRVAAKTFEQHPTAGVGARGFRWVYLEKGKSLETPERAHSLELDTLSETGLVGFGLLVFGLGLPLVAVARRGRRSFMAAAATAAGVYWLAHASVDWIWTFPTVTIPALLLLGIAAAPASIRTLSTGARLAVGGVAGAIAVLAFAPPWLSIRYTDEAYRDPSRAAADLRLARRLDPLSTAPYEAQAVLARSPEDIPPLQAAVRKQPRQVELRFSLGLAYLHAGRRAAARAELEKALALAPRSGDIERALRRAR
jgi:hypothetical protein